MSLFVFLQTKHIKLSETHLWGLVYIACILREIDDSEMATSFSFEHWAFVETSGHCECPAAILKCFKRNGSTHKSDFFEESDIFQIELSVWVTLAKMIKYIN